MARERGIEVLRMGAAIHIDGPPGVRTANANYDDALLFGHVQKLHPVGRVEHAWTTGGLAAHVRIVLRGRTLPVLIYGLRPRLERHLCDLRIGRQIHPSII